MTDIDWQEIHRKFSEAFRPEEIGTNQSNKGGGPYVDARSVAERLDAVVGPGAWMTDFTLMDPASGAVECRLTVHGVVKADIGYPNSIMGTLTKAGTMLEGEPLKAAYSDAFKRSAVQWGIGRYLYPYASKRKRQPGDDEVNTETGEITPNLDQLRASVRAAVINVAEAENLEATEVFNQGAKEKGIINPKGLAGFSQNELLRMLGWCESRLGMVQTQEALR